MLAFSERLVSLEEGYYLPVGRKCDFSVFFCIVSLEVTEEKVVSYEHYPVVCSSNQKAVLAVC